MIRKISALLLIACFAVGTIGCTVGTIGGADWEIYHGFRTKQTSEVPSVVSVESSVVDKVVDSLTDGTVSEQE